MNKQQVKKKTFTNKFIVGFLFFLLSSFQFIFLCFAQHEQITIWFRLCDPHDITKKKREENNNNKSNQIKTEFYHLICFLHSNSCECVCEFWNVCWKLQGKHLNQKNIFPFAAVWFCLWQWLAQIKSLKTRNSVCRYPHTWNKKYSSIWKRAYSLSLLKWKSSEWKVKSNQLVARIERNVKDKWWKSIPILHRWRAHSFDALIYCYCHLMGKYTEIDVHKNNKTVRISREKEKNHNVFI